MTFLMAISLIPPAVIGTVGFLFAAMWTVHVVSQHASKHGGEEVLARECLEQRGSWQVWLEPGERYHRLCQTADGEIYDQIVEWTGERWEEVTAFRPDPWGKGNGWNNIRRWLEKKGATPYKGPLPPPVR